MGENSMNIIDAKRTPIGGFQGVFKDIKAPALGAHALKAARGTVAPEFIDGVIMGCVLSAGVGQAPARQAALLSGLLDQTPAFTVNKVCGSGMKSVMLACDQILLQRGHLYLAGGMESMTNAPYLLDQARQGYRFGHFEFFDHMVMDGLEDAYQERLPMGVLAEKLAEEENFTKTQQDQFAVKSLEKARAAKDSLKSEMEPFVIEGRDAQTVETDEPVERAKIEKIPLLKPAFKKDGTITAASASGIADGAAALLLASNEALEKYGLRARAKILGYTEISLSPQNFTRAPVGAIEKLMKNLNWTMQDVDLFEINEAFAVVTMYAMKALKISEEKMNVFGGACALGHPIGASGARIMATLLNALEVRGLKRGIASACIGGGEAVAIAIERA